MRRIAGSVHNEMSGNAHNVVQAGRIGQVTFVTPRPVSVCRA